MWAGCKSDRYSFTTQLYLGAQCINWQILNDIDMQASTRFCYSTGQLQKAGVPSTASKADKELYKLCHCSLAT